MKANVQRLGALDRTVRIVALGSIVFVVIVAALVAGLAAGSWPTAAVFAVAMIAIASPGLLAVKAAFEQAGLTAAAENRQERTARIALEFNGRVERRLQAAEATNSSQQSMLTSQQNQLTGLSTSQQSQFTALSTSQQSADVRVDALEETTGASQGRIETLEDQIRVLRDRLNREQHRRHADVAVLRSSGQFPQRVVLQMTLARSGSTRLFDMLRCHNDVFMEPSDRIWNGLGLSGRRYPVGLSDLPGASTPVVVSPNSGSLIRSMRSDNPARIDPPSGSIAVEKAHPSFFDFDTDTFVAALADFESRHECSIDVVYQVRNPLDVMWSMAEYKQRSPGWHGTLTELEIPDLVHRSLAALCALLECRDGIIIDYSDVQAESRKLYQLAELLAPTDSPETHHNWIDTALARTEREKLTAHTTFVGPSGARSTLGPENCWSAVQSVIEECVDLHRGLHR